MELKILFPHARRAPMNSETQGAVYWSDLPPFCHSKTTRVPAMNIDVGGFVRLFSKHAKRIESIEDARKIGARELGIGSWCAAVGIDMELQEVPMQLVMHGFSVRPQVEVRRTVIHAVYLQSVYFEPSTLPCSNPVAIDWCGTKVGRGAPGLLR